MGRIGQEHVVARRDPLEDHEGHQERDSADVAVIMGRLLGWSRRRRGAETRRYLDLVEAERARPAMDSTLVPSLALAAAR